MSDQIVENGTAEIRVRVWRGITLGSLASVAVTALTVLSGAAAVIWTASGIYHDILSRITTIEQRQERAELDRRRDHQELSIQVCEIMRRMDPHAACMTLRGSGMTPPYGAPGNPG